MWHVISTVFSKPKDILRSLAVTCTVNVIISQIRCKQRCC